MALVTLVSILVLNKLITLFVDGVVGQVSKLVRLNIGRIVLFTGKPCKTFVKNVDAPRVHGGEQYVNSNIKFKSVYKQRIMDIFANYTWFIDRYF